MKPWLYVGAKLVCVDASGAAAPYINNGAIYTIREIVEVPPPHLDAGQIIVRLAEIPLPVHMITGHEHGFDPNRFRPLLPDTKRAVNEMRNLMLDATVSGKVDA